MFNNPFKEWNNIFLMKGKINEINSFFNFASINQMIEGLNRVIKHFRQEKGLTDKDVTLKKELLVRSEDVISPVYELIQRQPYSPQ